MSPRVQIDHYSIRIYFGDALHVYIKRSDFLGLQSWSDGPHDFSIEFALRGECLTVQYDDANTWRAILTGLDDVL